MNKPVAFMLDEYNHDAFEALPQGIRDIIGKSPEFKNLNGMAIDTALAGANATQPFDDEIPF